MPRYIDADALRKEFSERPPDYYSTGYILDTIEDLPALSTDEVRGVAEYRDTIINTLHEHRMQMDESYDDSDFALGYAEAFKVVCMIPQPGQEDER